MKRTTRTLVILTVAAWIAVLTPAWAGTGSSGAPPPAPGLAGDDPVRIGVGVGGELIDVLSHDEDNGDDDGDDGDEDGDHNGRGLLDLLLGNGDDDGDEDGDGLLDELVNVVDRVVEILFGENGDSVDSPTGLSVASVASVRPADDDDGLVPQVLEALEDLDLDRIEPVEDVLDLLDDTVNFVAAGENQVVATICQLRHALATGFALGVVVVPLIGPILVMIPPIGPMPTCVP